MTVLLMAGGGCQAAGFAAAMLKPPVKVEAQYKPPTTRPIAVLVDSDRARGSGAQALGMRDSLASYIVQELRKNEVGIIIDSSKIYDLRTSNPKAFKTMSVDEIGRRVGADQVIVVDILKVNVSESTGGQLLHGELSALVRVVDAKTGQTLWPANLSDGFPMDIDTPFTQTDDTTNMATVRDGIGLGAGDQIAKLFYTWTVPE